MAGRRILSILRPLVVLTALAALMTGPVAAQVSQETGVGPFGSAGGSSTFPGPSPEGDVGILWELEIPEGYNPVTSVAWGDYALVIANSEEFGDNLIVHDLHTGDFLWNYAVEGRFNGPFVSDGHVYLSHDARRFAFDIATGELLWDVTLDDGELAANSASGLVTAADGVVYTNQNATLFALDGATGDERWRRTFPGFAMGFPILAGDVVVISSRTWEDDQPLAARLHGISRESGNEVWRRDSSDPRIGYESSFNGQVVLVYEYPDNEFVLSDASIVQSDDGQVIWKPFHMCEEPDLSLSVHGDIYRCLGSTEILDAATGEVVDSPAMIPAEAYIIARVADHLYLSNSGMLTALDLASGNTVWSYDFSGEIGELESNEYAFFAASAGNDAVVIDIDILKPDGFRQMTFILGNLPAPGASPAASPVATPAN